MNLREVFSNIIFDGLESIGRYYSSYRGYVVDNEDEEDLGRLQVKIPSITHNKTHPVWAYPKNQWGGKDYGMQLLPLKGEIVWIEFEHGDPRFPIWNFAHRAIGEKPEEFISSKIYGFKTPKGQLIIIDDREEKVYVSLINAQGAEVEYETPLIAFNGGLNAGWVKVKELTLRLNAIEQKINDFLAHYKVHRVVDPISGFAGPLDPGTPAPVDVDETTQSNIENNKILH